MCGIVGLRSYGTPVNCDKLIAGMAALRHRGPDGEGYWLAPHQRVGLAHTRLSIIDHATGAQPIFSEDGQIAVAVNGELYGFEAIRATLESRGHRFSTRSDAEILVHLYEEYGTECLEHLRGEFAFVLWDERNDILFAARDRFGIKPLFYSETGGMLYLASEAKALFAAGVPAAWDRDIVFQSLFACVSQDRSLFQGVRQIPPGHYLIASANGIQLHRYWDADYPIVNRSAPVVSPDDCLEQVRALLDDAVRVRMRADVAVGCLLSGGLDSAAVLGMAMRYTDTPIAAYTISFDDPEYDETTWARQAAQFSGAEFNIVPATNACLGDYFEESVRQGEIMQYNAHGTARFILSKAISGAGYKTVLGGEGADEIFAGYGFSKPSVLARSDRGRITAGLRLLWRVMRPNTPNQATIAERSPCLARATRAVDLPDALLTSAALRMNVLHRVIAPAFAEDYRDWDPFRKLFEAIDPAAMTRGREPAKKLIYLWLKTMFPGYILAADRADMAHGLEVRLPFLDHVLFDFMRGIPVRTLAHGGEIKHLLREAAAPVISPVTRKRLKKPLMAPPFTLRKGNRLFAVVNDLLRAEAMRDLPFFDRRELVNILDGLHAPGYVNDGLNDPLLIMAASLTVLQESYGLRAS